MIVEPSLHTRVRDGILHVAARQRDDDRGDDAEQRREPSGERRAGR
jgi:hypothetical protein